MALMAHGAVGEAASPRACCAPGAIGHTRTDPSTTCVIEPPPVQVTREHAMQLCIPHLRVRSSALSAYSYPSSPIPTPPPASVALSPAPTLLAGTSRLCLRS